MGDSERRLMAGRRSVLLGMAGLATAALAACATNRAPVHLSSEGALTGGTPSPPAGTSGSITEAPGGGPATAPPSVATRTSEQAAASLADRNGDSDGGLETGDREPASGTSATPLPVPDRQQIIAEFGGLYPKEWGLHVTGVVNRSTSRHAVLTFDACGGSGGEGCDTKLLTTLRRLNVPATLFINSRWIVANPSLAAELADDPLFELANHGTRHLPLSVNGKAAYGIPGTGSVAAAYDEVMGNQALMAELTGVVPRFFRPGTAFYDDVAAAMTRRCGVLPVNFTVNGDGGATFPPGVVAAEVGRVGAGDIVISHFNRPASGTAEGYARSLPHALDRGVTFARLGDVLPLHGS
ncbi:polysaccharide deacetylase family protein [Paenarthrobacter sp. NPDC089322]|uniref:polysaccharide deacetylase family protein n=1 Tax=Paenarthrobacter sp. NPDC089322 TaxID=3155065 RepID=UPI00341AC7CD